MCERTQTSRNCSCKMWEGTTACVQCFSVPWISFHSTFAFWQHPIQAGAGCSQKNLGWYVTFEFSVGDVAECHDSHRCTLDSQVVCRLRLLQSGWLKYLSCVGQLWLFGAKRRVSQSEETGKHFQSGVGGGNCRAAGLHPHHGGGCAKACRDRCGKGQ